MSMKQKRIVARIGVLALFFAMAPSVNAMHIMEGYLPAGYAIAWGLICLPFLAAGFFSIKNTLKEHRSLITLLAMSGAFVFVVIQAYERMGKYNIARLAAFFKK